MSAGATPSGTLAILVVYYLSSDDDLPILDLHLDRIERHTRVPFQVYGAANRDEDVFVDPDRFDVGRDPNPHMAFGAGPHVCAGQFLARMELRILVEEWFKRISKFTLAPGYEAEFRSWQVMALSQLDLKIVERTERR